MALALAVQWAANLPEWEYDTLQAKLQLLATMRATHRDIGGDDMVQAQLVKAQMVALDINLTDAVVRAKKQLARLRAVLLTYTPRGRVQNRIPFPGPAPLLHEASPDRIDTEQLYHTLRSFGLRREEAMLAIANIDSSDWMLGPNLYMSHVNNDDPQQQLSVLRSKIYAVNASRKKYEEDLETLISTHIPGPNILPLSLNPEDINLETDEESEEEMEEETDEETDEEMV